MKSDFVAILIDSAGEIIDAITDGVDDGIIVITESKEWFDNLKDLASSFMSFFK